MTKNIKSDLSEQTVESRHAKMKNNSLSNGRPSAAVICFIIAIVLSAGILTGCGGSGSSGNGNDHLNGIDSTHSMNLGVTTWKSVESG